MRRKRKYRKGMPPDREGEITCFFNDIESCVPPENAHVPPPHHRPDAPEPLPTHSDFSDPRPSAADTPDRIENIPPQLFRSEKPEVIRFRFSSQWERDNGLARDEGHSWSFKQWCKWNDQRVRSLQYAPQKWLRKAWNMRRYTTPRNSEKRGTWIYRLFSTRTGKVYVGQTGAIGFHH